MSSKLRVFLSDGPRDFDASKVDIAPDGSMSITKIEMLEGPKIATPGGDNGARMRVTLLAIVGPDGKLRAETVELEEPEELPAGVAQAALVGGFFKA